MEHPLVKFVIRSLGPGYKIGTMQGMHLSVCVSYTDGLSIMDPKMMWMLTLILKVT